MYLLIFILILIIILLYSFTTGAKEEKIAYLHTNCINPKIVEKAIGFKTTTKMQDNYYLILIYNSHTYKDGISKEYYADKNIFYKSAKYFNKLSTGNIFGTKYLTHSLIEKYLPHLIGEYVPISSNKPWKDMKFPVICKPTFGTYVGVGIEMFNDKKSLTEFLDKKLYPEYIIQEYIKDISLYKGKKFHIRVYYMLTDDLKYDVFMDGEILTALKKYNPNIFNDKDITDSHGKSTADMVYMSELPYWKDIHKQLMYFFDEITTMISKMNIKLNKRENTKAFEVFGCDFLITNKLKIILVEINKKSGFGLSGYDSEPKKNIKKLKDFTYRYFKWIKDFIGF